MLVKKALSIIAIAILAGCTTSPPKPEMNIGSFPDFKLEELQGVEDSEFAAYYDNGQLKQHAWIRDECLDQKLSTYYENGKPKTVIPISHCKANGLVKGYYPSGNVEYELYVVNGIPHGSFLKYHDTATNGVAMRAVMKNGEFNGLIEQLDDDGKALKRGVVKNGTATSF